MSNINWFESYELSDEQIFELVFSNERKFPNKFWDDEGAKEKACNAIRYLINIHLKWDYETVINNYSKKTLFENNLRGMLNKVFDGNEIDALIESLPEYRNEYDEILNNLKNISIKNERIISDSEILKLYPKKIIDFYFNSIKNLGYLIRNEYTREELINILKDRAIKLKRVPSSTDMIIPQAIVFIREFDSWENALGEAGLDY